MAKDEKDKTLNRLLSKLEKNFECQKASEIIIEPKSRSGLYPLDYVLDGGFSQMRGGHIVEFYGGESSGKTTISKIVIAEYQKQGKSCVFINAEGSYDPTWAAKMGVDNDKVIIVTPRTLEETGDLLIELIGEVDLVVVDSISAIVAEEELEESLEKKAYAAQAKVNSPMCRKINNKRHKGNTTIIFINQLREKVGVVYGSPITTSGGRALKHLYDSRIEFRPGKPINVGSGDKKETIGFEINLKAVKNKKGVPRRTAVFDFFISGDIDNKTSLFFSAIKFGVITLSGQMYTYKDKVLRGKDKMMSGLTDKDYKDIQDEIWKRI